MTDRPLRSVRRRAQSRSPPRGRRKLLLRHGARVACTRIGGDLSYLGDYRNQVGIWTSSDGGLNWTPVNWNNTMFFTNPLINTGFSDPSMTQDEGGNIYDTGIDLANDSLFSSSDGGLTWPTGTADCHDGDRPWLA